jgi:hypothetical protein
MKTYTIIFERKSCEAQALSLTGFIASLKVAKALADTRQGVVLMRDETTLRARRVPPAGGT